MIGPFSSLNFADLIHKNINAIAKNALTMYAKPTGNTLSPVVPTDRLYDVILNQFNDINTAA
jgi:hypothetical protein